MPRPRTPTGLFGFGALAFVSITGLLSCGGSHEVPRKSGDSIEYGRHISPQAYAWYARGLHFERNGQLQSAEAAFQSAIDNDRESGSAWAALIRVRCETNDKAALEAAAQGLRRAQRRAPVLSARAACLLQTWGTEPRKQDTNGLLQQALEDSQKAVALEPAYAPANQLVGRCLRLLGRDATARRWERAFALYVQAPPEPRAERAAAQRIDAALLADDLDQARRFAVSELSAGQLAVRALAWGKTELATEQAVMTLKASPRDPDATLVQYLLNGTMPPPETDDGISELGALLLARALQREVSPKAALLFWNRVRPGESDSQDPLLIELARESKLPLP